MMIVALLTAWDTTLVVLLHLVSPMSTAPPGLFESSFGRMLDYCENRPCVIVFSPGTVSACVHDCSSGVIVVARAATIAAIVAVLRRLCRCYLC